MYGACTARQGGHFSSVYRSDAPTRQALVAQEGGGCHIATPSGGQTSCGLGSMQVSQGLMVFGVAGDERGTALLCIHMATYDFQSSCF